MATVRRLRGRWQAQVRRKGLKPRAKSFDNKQDAERWARSLESEFDQFGIWADTSVAEKMTLANLLDRYIRDISPLKRSGKSEAYRIRPILKRDIAYRTLIRLSTSDIAAYRDERLKQVSAATVIKELNIIGHAIEVARREWNLYLPQNPCRLVRRPSPPRGRDRRLQAGEEARLLNATEGGRNPYMRHMIVFAIETAMRQGEILSLTWSDIDETKRLAHLDITKNGERRDVPLSTRAMATLAALRKMHNDEHIFPTTKSAVGQAWLHLRKRAGMEDFRFHDLRHEAVTRLLEKGLNIIEVATISGHKELKMLQRYSHLRAVDLVARLG